ncbi:hypothetical protein B0H13DRAFT_1925368 [Mycena leptocephala]|nr:hypothetical protein B0H13DRAFT_1925368 [Mycena leptocephala]
MPLSSATIPIYLSDSPLAAKQKKCTVVKSTTGKTTTWPNDPAIACTPATSFHTNMNSTPATLNAKPQTIFYASFAQGTMLRRNLLLGRRLGDGGEVEVGRDFSVCVCVDPTRRRTTQHSTQRNLQKKKKKNYRKELEVTHAPGTPMHFWWWFDFIRHGNLESLNDIAEISSVVPSFGSVGFFIRLRDNPQPLDSTRSTGTRTLCSHSFTLCPPSNDATRKLSLKLKKFTNSVFPTWTPSQAILKPDSDRTPSSDICSPNGTSGQNTSDFTRSNSPPTSTPSTPAVSQILTSVHPEDPGSPGWKAFMQGLGIVKDVSVVFPPLQAAMTGLFRVLEKFEEITYARNELGAMAQRMTALASLLRRAIVHQRRMIEKKLALGMRNIIANSPDAHDVIQCIRAISFLINIFELDTALNTEAKATEMKNQVHYLGIQNIPLTPCDPDLLEKLSPVAGISYDERGIQGSSECMPGTRVGVLTELMAWASDPESPPIYLLTGMAGAGKTAIARSFARLIDAEMFLGASFFCSRATEGSSDAGRIIHRSPSISRGIPGHMHRH